MAEPRKSFWKAPFLRTLNYHNFQIIASSVFSEFTCTTSSQLSKAQQLPEPISFLGRWGLRAGTTAQLELCEGLEETFIPPDTVTYCVGHNVIWVTAASLWGINSSSAGSFPSEQQGSISIQSWALQNWDYKPNPGETSAPEERGGLSVNSSIITLHLGCQTSSMRIVHLPE